jgi:hypothetical protein
LKGGKSLKEIIIEVDSFKLIKILKEAINKINTQLF